MRLSNNGLSELAAGRTSDLDLLLFLGVGRELLAVYSSKDNTAHWPPNSHPITTHNSAALDTRWFAFSRGAVLGDVCLLILQ